MQFGGKEQKEVLHISYDYRTRVIVALFKQDYVMTVNLEDRSSPYDECKCLGHLEINNFTISEFEVQNSIFIQKLRRPNQVGYGVGSTDFELAILFD